MRKQSAISTIIAMQDWDKLRVILSADVGREAVQREMMTSSDFGTESALSYTCRFHPPIDIIRAITKLLPRDIVRQIDPMGRTCLHTAAKWGASPRVIRFLAEAYPASVSMPDTSGKTALHLACESYASKYSSRKADGKPVKEATLEVVRYLCKLSPKTVNLEDKEEFTALEYAIENDLDIKVVRSLQKACEKDWKKRRAAGAQHDDVRQDLLLHQQQSQRNVVIDSNQLAIPNQKPLQHSSVAPSTTDGGGVTGGNKTRKRGSILGVPTRGQPMDIGEVSKALSALGTETKNVDDPGSAKVALTTKPRKTPSTRAIMA